MKFNKLAKDLGLSVTELAEKASAILPNANGGTEVNEEQEKSIRALLTQPEVTEGLPATFDTTTAPTDESLANAALDGIITDYSYRLRGAAIANAWIEQRAGGEGANTYLKTMGNRDSIFFQVLHFPGVAEKMFGSRSRSRTFLSLHGQASHYQTF